jgi:3-methyladenine DNA glycosylase/8-oxoguanine DNA glycosylase
MTGGRLRAWSHRFRPWRSYAAEHLWAHRLAARDTASRDRLEQERRDAP